MIHLMELPNPDPVDGRPDHGGRDRHAAFGIDDVKPLVERLERHGVPYTMSKSGRAAVFFRDPDGNAMEFMVRGAATRGVAATARACPCARWAARPAYHQCARSAYHQCARPFATAPRASACDCCGR